MTLDEMRAVLIPFALAIRADFDGPTQRAYLRVLKDVPAALLQSAVTVAEREADMKFLPSAPEWLGRCETERRRLMALQPYEPCTRCNGVGNVRLSAPGEFPKRYGRCQCWTSYLERMEALGVPQEPLAALPAAREEPETFASPDIDHVQDYDTAARVRDISASKVMR